MGYLFIIYVSREIIAILNQVLIVSCFVKIEFSFSKIKTVMLFIAYVFIQYLMFIFLSLNIAVSLSLFLSFLYFLIILKNTLFKNCCLFLLSVLIDATLEFVVQMLLDISNHTSKFVLLPVLIKLVGLTIISLVSLFTTRINKERIKIRTVGLYMYLAIGFLIGLVILNVVLFHSHLLPFHTTMTMIITAFVGVLGSLIMSKTYLKNENTRYTMNQELALKDKLLQLEKQNFVEMIESYSNLRSFRHDMNGYLTSIQYLIDDKDYKELANLTYELGKT